MNELTAAHFSIRTGSSGVAMIFGPTPPEEEAEDDDSFTVKLSHQDAKALAMMLRRQLKRYEREGQAEIILPAEVMKDFGVTPDDW